MCGLGCVYSRFVCAAQEREPCGWRWSAYFGSDERPAQGFMLRMSSCARWAGTRTTLRSAPISPSFSWPSPGPRNPCAPPCFPASGWWYKPDFIINDLNINSAVARPWHDEVISLQENKPYTCRGYAYAGAALRAHAYGISRDHCLYGSMLPIPKSAQAAIASLYCQSQYDICLRPGGFSILQYWALITMLLPTLCFAGGGRKIIRVEMSLDDGISWRLADIQRFEKPNEYGKPHKQTRAVAWHSGKARKLTDNSVYFGRMRLKARAHLHFTARPYLLRCPAVPN